MADKHPYVASVSGLAQLLKQLRKSFPSVVNSETLQKLGILPKNESYGIAILKFLGIIDEEGKKTDRASVFSQHEDQAFQNKFSELVKGAYSDLFQLQGEDAWSLEKSKLIQFFRTADNSSDIIGQRQAATFQVLSAFAGHGELPDAKAKTTQPKNPKPVKKLSAKKPPLASKIDAEKVILEHSSSKQNVGLTVRIEINLPVAEDQKTYDNIFRSLRENLLNG
jgi:hypothetical protein